MRAPLPLAVILGRAGAAAFRARPECCVCGCSGQPTRALCSDEDRGIDEHTARQRLSEVDGARAQYVRRLYGADIDDPAYIICRSTVRPPA